MLSHALPPITELLPGIISAPLPVFTITAPQNITIGPQVSQPLNVQPIVPVNSIQTIPAQKTRKVAVKNKFTAEEDKLLFDIASQTKVHNWNEIAKKVGTRNARQCRERWNNYLDSSLRNDPWTEEEDRLLIEMHAIYGTHWNKISKCFIKRSDNSIRNRWQLLMRHIEKRNVSSNQSSSSQMSE